MSGNKIIAVSWLTFGILVLTFFVWTFTNMGDCAAGMICQRPWWLDLVIFGSGLVLWAAGVRLVMRRNRN